MKSRVILIHTFMLLTTSTSVIEAILFGNNGCCCSCGLPMPSYCGCKIASVCPPPLPCPLPACPVCQLCSLPPPCPLPPIPVCPAPQPVQLQLPCTCGAAQGPYFSGGYAAGGGFAPGGGYQAPPQIGPPQFRQPETGYRSRIELRPGYESQPAPQYQEQPLHSLSVRSGAESVVTQEIIEPESHALNKDDPPSSATQAEPSEIDDKPKAEASVTISESKCNNEKLMDLISKNIVEDDPVESKRAIHKAALEEIQDSVIDIICSDAGFTYIVSTTEYCEAQKRRVICFIYKKP